MHKPYNKFKGWLTENGKTYKDVGELLGVSVTTVFNKINGKSDFLLSEVLRLEEEYNIDGSIFFVNDVA